MASTTEIINSGNWTMSVHTFQVVPGSLLTLRISNIRSNDKQLPDWTDADNSYVTHEEGVAAARKWVLKALS